MALSALSARQCHKSQGTTAILRAGAGSIAGDTLDNSSLALLDFASARGVCGMSAADVAKSTANIAAIVAIQGMRALLLSLPMRALVLLTLLVPRVPFFPRSELPKQ